MILPTLFLRFSASPYTRLVPNTITNHGPFRARNLHEMKFILFFFEKIEEHLYVGVIVKRSSLTTVFNLYSPPLNCGVG